MSANQSSPINLDLDLAFHPANDDALTSLVDADTKRRLTNASPWQQDLKAWIESVRRDPTLTCPEIVRLSPMLSLGLQLTDDATMTELNHSWRQRSETTDVLSFQQWITASSYQQTLASNWATLSSQCKQHNAKPNNTAMNLA